MCFEVCIEEKEKEHFVVIITEKTFFQRFQKPGKGRSPHPSHSSSIETGKKAAFDTSLRVSCVQLFSHGHSNTTKKPGADGRHVGGEWIAEIPGVTRENSGY